MTQLEDIATRNGHDEEFVMAVDDCVYSGKNAREEAGAAITKTIMSSLWEDGQELKLKGIGHFKGFTLMSSISGREGETPRLYLRGKHTYEVNLNTENPFGTIASIEYTLRRLDKDAEEEKAKPAHLGGHLPTVLWNAWPGEIKEELPSLRHRRISYTS